MSMSAAKKAEKKEALRMGRRTAIVRRVYPQWPSGVLESNWEAAILHYIRTGEVSDRLPWNVRRAIDEG